jgi:hypothetical protein
LCYANSKSSQKIGQEARAFVQNLISHLDNAPCTLRTMLLEEGSTERRGQNQRQSCHTLHGKLHDEAHPKTSMGRDNLGEQWLRQPLQKDK